jgi:hypothetical protein
MPKKSKRCAKCGEIVYSPPRRSTCFIPGDAPGSMIPYHLDCLFGARDANLRAILREIADATQPRAERPHATAHGLVLKALAILEGDTDNG